MIPDELFSPRSVAVVGASEREGSVGRAIMENLLERFKGMIYPVNIKRKSVLGLKAYPRLSELPEAPDLVVVAVPAKFVPEVIREAGKVGAKAAIVISAGFKEVGPEGAKLEEELVEAAREAGLRVLGPNCLGVYDAHTGLDTIFNPSDRQGKPRPGNVAFISQSGALGAAILDWLHESGIGMSKFISYGNAADIKEWELIEYLANDPKTMVIGAYIEGVEDGRAFMRAVGAAVKAGKPVVVLKAGKSERGARAVSSHTGSLAGSYRVYEAALKQAGAIIVNELSDLIVALKTLSWLPAARGDRIGIVTNGGGAGVLATDAIELSGLRMADLTSETINYLRDRLPPAAAVGNPVDVLGDAPPERYEVAVDAVMADPGVDAVLVIGIMQSPAFRPRETMEAVRSAVRKHGKPVVFVGPGGEYTTNNLKMIEREAGIPAFKTPEEGVRALGYLVTWGKVLRAHGLGRKR